VAAQAGLAVTAAETVAMVAVSARASPETARPETATPRGRIAAGAITVGCSAVRRRRLLIAQTTIAGTVKSPPASGMDILTPGCNVGGR
jgi:hypothetical protein